MEQNHGLKEFNKAGNLYLTTLNLQKYFQTFLTFSDTTVQTDQRGGVVILAHKSFTALEQPEYVTESDIEWVKILMVNRKDLYTGVFYMIQRNQQDLTNFKYR